jgi:hypothetical protein
MFKEFLPMTKFDLLPDAAKKKIAAAAGLLLIAALVPAVVGVAAVVEAAVPLAGLADALIDARHRPADDVAEILRKRRRRGR